MLVWDIWDNDHNFQVVTECFYKIYLLNNIVFELHTGLIKKKTTKPRMTILHHTIVTDNQKFLIPNKQ